MKSWIKQRADQVEKLGASKAPFYVYWREPSGRLRKKSCGIGPVGRAAAKQLAERLHIELTTGKYAADDSGISLEELCQEYLGRCRAKNHRPRSLVESEHALNLLKEFLGGDFPIRRIRSKSIDNYIAARRTAEVEGWRKVSPATINKELRTVKALLRMAADREYIAKAPRIEMLKVDEKAPTFVSGEQFVQLLGGVSVAEKPVLRNVPPDVWWRGLLTFAFFTGWRIEQILSLRWEDFDQESGRILTSAEDNKGRRDLMIVLHPIAVQAIKPLSASFEERIFRWPHRIRELWTSFHAIQNAAGLPMAGKRGGRFGFHDLRRGFATENAGSLSAFQLQQLMQHKSITTTQKYVAMGTPAIDAVDLLKVPKGLELG